MYSISGKTTSIQLKSSISEQLITIVRQSQINDDIT
jgi:hypothetical protein